MASSQWVFEIILPGHVHSLSTYMNHTEIAQRLADHAEAFAKYLFPNARLQSGQLCVGSILGEPGDSLKITITGQFAGRWKDWATGDAGDLLALLREARALTQIEAADQARAWLSLPAFSATTPTTKRVDPLALICPGLNRTGDAAWTYHAPDGSILAYVVRFNEPGGKSFRPLRPVLSESGLPTGRYQWTGYKGTEKRPLYNLHHLTRYPDKPVLVVEGEKTAEAAAKLFPSHVCVSWMGGTSNVTKADWVPLTGRAVTIWPDNDDPGIKAATYIKAIFRESRLVDTSSLPPKWDLADPAPDGVSLQGLLDAPAAAPAPTPSAPGGLPFLILGVDGTDYCYLPAATGSIVRLKAADHTELNLQRIAPDSLWLSIAVSAKSVDPDYKACAKHLIALSHARGVFDASRIRGRGCTVDDGRVVFHAGDRLYVDGVETVIPEHRSKLIYPSGRAIEVDLSNPLSSIEASQLVELCSMLPWDNEPAPWMFAASLFIAPICGALPWRPHLWLTGKSGSGKSWTFDQVVKPVLGDSCIQVASSTTGAGIRAALRMDSLPVIFDEFESKDPISRARNVTTLELARQASSDSSAHIIKGTPTGESKHYSVRSMFLFASIQTASVDHADINRINLFTLTNRHTPGSFQALTDLAARTTGNHAWCLRLRARAIRYAREIRASANTFTTILAGMSGNARNGQQLGSVFAGYWMMENDVPPTQTEAQSFVSRLHHDSRTEQGETDENRSLRILLQAKLQYKSGETRSVEELLASYFQNATSDDGAHQSTAQFAYDVLMRHGIHPIGPETRGVSGFMTNNHFDVANFHEELSKIYHSSPYAVKWRQALLGFPGTSETIFSSVSKRRMRAVRIPFDPDLQAE